MSDLPDYQIPINISAITLVSLPIDIVAQTIGNLAIDIAAQSVGNLAVNIAASAITLNINIAAQAVDLNIKTSGGANIIIDKLVQGAYTENRTTLSNNGSSVVDTTVTGLNRIGKYFPRGCRGFLGSIEVNCRNTGAADKVISIYIAPQMGMNYILSGAITVTAGATQAWRSVAINRMWNYDSMFIYAVANSIDIGIFYDTYGDLDAYNSADSGSTWATQDRRYYMRVNMKGETIGDLPISGTVNIIEIPASASKGSITSVNVPNSTETSIITISGSGTLLQAHIMFSGNVDPTAAVYYVMYIYADGNYAMMIVNHELTQSDTATAGTNSEGEFFKRGTNYIMNVRIPIKFKYSLEIRAGQTTGGQITVDAFITYNKVQ